MMRLHKYFSTGLIAVAIYALPLTVGAAEDKCMLAAADSITPPRCRALCEAKAPCNSALAQLDDARGQLKSAQTTYNDAVEKIFDTVMYTNADGKNRRDKVAEAQRLMTRIKTTLMPDPLIGYRAKQGIKTPRAYVAALSGALSPGDNRRAVQLRLAHEQVLAIDGLAYHDKFDELIQEIERVKMLLTKVAGWIDKKDDQTSLKKRLPSPIRGKNSQNIFAILAGNLYEKNTLLMNLKTKEKVYKKAQTTLNAQLDKFNAPAQDAPDSGHTVKITKALFGVKSGVRYAFEDFSEKTKLDDLPEGVCVATGYFRRQCEFLAANMEICRTMDGKKTTLRGACLKTDQKPKSNNEQKVGDNLEYRPRKGADKLKLCVAKVDLKQTCGGRNPAINERRMVRVGFKCGGDPEIKREAWEGETLYLYCK